MTLSDEIKALVSTLEMQLQGFAKSAYEKDLRIAELEALYQEAFSNNRAARQRIYALDHAAPSAPAVEQQFKLDDIEQYRMQMAGISTAAIGYWKEGDSIHPDYDTIALRDVAKLYAKYDALYKASEAAAPQAAGTDKVQTHKDVEWLIESAEIDKKNPALAAEIRAKCKAASAAVDTDKVREAILALRIVPPRHYDNAQISAFCLGAKTMCEEAAKLTASMAAQAPVREVPEGWKLVPRQLTEEQSREIVYNINRKYKGNPMSDFLAREAWLWGMHAAPAAPVREVPGYKLVPIEATEDMQVAFLECWFSKRRGIDDDIGDAYAELLAAAPLPAAPVQQEG